MTWLLTLGTRIKAYVLIGLATVAALAVAILQVRASGAASEKLSRAADQLKTKRMEAQVEAQMAATTASARRERLRDRWSKR